MSAEIINLRRARKAKARRARETKAAENRAIFGRSASERERQEREQERTARGLDQHRRTGEEHCSNGETPPAVDPETPPTGPEE